MGCGRHKVECANCGFEVVSKDQRELVALVQWHVRNAHQREIGPNDVLGMAKHP
jgi:predicted small metal-binding protein